MRYYVVADVHGYYTELEKALKSEGFFDCAEQKKLIVCGDLFDRGREAVKLQKFILELMDRNEVVLIRGNHEDLAVKFVEEADYIMDEGIVYTHHWSNGTVKTILQLTDMGITDAMLMPKKMRIRAENTPFFKKIMPAMLNYFETENYIFVHGWIPCNTIGEQYRPIGYNFRPDWREASDLEWETARWYNGMAAAADGVTEKGKTIVCGHWHCSFGHAVIEGKSAEFGDEADFSPYRNDGIIAIDACTAVSKKVNCIVIDDEQQS